MNKHFKKKNAHKGEGFAFWNFAFFEKKICHDTQPDIIFKNKIKWHKIYKLKHSQNNERLAFSFKGTPKYHDIFFKVQFLHKMMLLN
jgi:hypothetical protein